VIQTKGLTLEGVIAGVNMLAKYKQTPRELIFPEPMPPILWTEEIPETSPTFGTIRLQFGQWKEKDRIIDGWHVMKEVNENELKRIQNHFMGFEMDQPHAVAILKDGNEWKVSIDWSKVSK